MPEPTNSAPSADRSALTSPDEITTPDDFHRALRMLLEETQTSVRMLSAKLGIGKVAISEILRGRVAPHPDRLRLLLEALDLSPLQVEAWMAAFWRIREMQRPPVSGTAEAERIARRDLSEAENELVSAPELTLPALWKVTHARLDYYHQIATGQARKSFRNAQIAMGIGFALLVVFAILALYAQSTATAIVTGALGATSAAFAAYIGRTFVRSQETAATHLRSYFDQPLEFSRYLAAERLLNGIERLEPDQHAAITTEVLRGILPATNANGEDKPGPAGIS
ncbi:helix-turn-helix domain-containing protein [Nonomuraea sp. NPDC004297]